MTSQGKQTRMRVTFPGLNVNTQRTNQERKVDRALGQDLGDLGLSSKSAGFSTLYTPTGSSLGMRR